MAEHRRVSFNDISLLLSSTFSSGVYSTAMDVSTSLKMSSLTTQSLFSYVEEENLSAIKAHLDKYREVDTRSEVSVQEPLKHYSVLFSARSSFTLHIDSFLSDL